MERDDRELLAELLEAGEFVTKRNIVNYLAAAQDCGQLGIAAVLSDYQKAHLS